MDMRTIAIATGVFVLLVAASMAGAVLLLDDGTSSTSGPPQPSPEWPESAHKQMEDYILSGFTVAFWAEGRPFVNYTDSVTGEVVKQDIFQALFWMAQTVDDMTGVRTNHGAPITGAEAAYRLGLIYEHGLFRYQKDPREAVRYYRIARVGGHAKGDEAATRLESAGH